jgi:hypothetical protein
MSWYTYKCKLSLTHAYTHTSTHIHTHAYLAVPSVGVVVQRALSVVLKSPVLNETTSPKVV